MADNQTQTAIAVPKDSAVSLDDILKTASQKASPVEDLDELLIAAIKASEEETRKASFPEESLDELLLASPPEVTATSLDKLLS